MDCLKNTLEEIVINRVEKEFNSNNDMCQCIQCKKDVTVFILNNIKPRYIISTRGMLHEAANTSERKKIEAEIDELLPKGMERVKTHKRPNFDHSDTSKSLLESVGKKERFTMTENYNYNFPFFIGETQQAKNDEDLSDVKVTLTINDKIIEGWDGNWPNPYITSDKSACKFAFWPKTLPAENTSEITNEDFKFKVIFEKEGYNTKEVDFTIKMESQKYIINFIRKDYTKDLGIIKLEAK